MNKIFSIDFDSPEDCISLYFYGDENKTKEDFMEAMRIYLIAALNRKSANFLQNYHSFFVELDYPDDEILLLFQETMKERGFELVKPDISVSDNCWSRVGKIKGKYRIEHFGGTGDFSNYLLNNGFKIDLSRTR